jgi:hypothetical protein
MKIPFRVTLTIWLVLTITVWNILRAWTALSWQATLAEFSAKPAPWVTALSGGIWAITGIVLVWSILQRKDWASKLLIGVAAGYSIWYWSERLIWQSPRSNWLFAVVANLVIVGFILFSTRSMTREAYERESQNQKTE